MQLVFEFCAYEARPVLDGVRAVLGLSEYAIHAGRGWQEVPTEGPPESIIARLETGEIDSFVAYPKSGPVRYAMVLSPACRDNGSYYLGTVEYTARDYERLWNLLLGLPDLVLVCLGYEEGVELGQDLPNADTLPWAQWPLVVGAVRDAQSSNPNGWIIKEGPEMRWFKDRIDDATPDRAAT